MVPDLGDKRLISFQSVIEARRAVPPEEKSIWSRAAHFFGKSFSKTITTSSLSSLKIKGTLPEDFIENQIRFNQMNFTIDDMHDFGFTFNHFLEMGFAPVHFKKFSAHNYKQLGIRARDMLRTSMTIHDLIDLNLTPQELHSLGFTMEMFQSIGGTKDNMKKLCSESDLNLYFKRSGSKVGKKPAQIKKSAASSSKLIF